MEKSWTITEGERRCVLLSRKKKDETKKRVSSCLSANVLEEKICHHSFLPPPARVTRLDINNTNKYHPVSHFLSLCCTGKAVPETIRRLQLQHTAPTHCSFRFEMPKSPWTCCSLPADQHPSYCRFVCHMPVLDAAHLVVSRDTHLNTSPYLKGNHKTLQDDLLAAVIFVLWFFQANTDKQDRTVWGQLCLHQADRSPLPTLWRHTLPSPAASEPYSLPFERRCFWWADLNSRVCFCALSFRAQFWHP